MLENKIEAWLSAVLIAFFLTGCMSPTPETSLPTEALAPVTFTATRQVTSTPTPTATPTAQPTPTAFVTAPAATEFANVPILMYHHFNDLPNNATPLALTWTVKPQNFEAHMNWLSQQGFHTITMAQLVGHLTRHQPLPTKPLIISFDDGWAEDYSVAFPILKKYNFIGVFFIYTRPLDRPGFLSWGQVEEMSGAGMEIEAHTLTHPHLRSLAPDAAAKEIGESKGILENRLHKPVVAFAYPFGEYNAAIIEMVKRAGYECAVTINSGYRQRADQIFLLQRIRVSYQDTLQGLTSRLPQ